MMRHDARINQPDLKGYFKALPKEEARAETAIVRSGIASRHGSPEAVRTRNGDDALLEHKSLEAH